MPTFYEKTLTHGNGIYENEMRKFGKNWRELKSAKRIVSDKHRPRVAPKTTDLKVLNTDFDLRLRYNPRPFAVESTSGDLERSEGRKSDVFHCEKLL